MDSGLSFDVSSDVYGGEDSTLAVGSGKGRGGSRSSVWEEAVKGVGPQKERDGGGYFPATADSIKQQYRTAFCALKHTRKSYKPAIYVDSGLSFDASSGVYGERTWPLRLEVARLGVAAVAVGRKGLRGQGHRESETAGTFSSPRPVAFSSNTAQPSRVETYTQQLQTRHLYG